MSTRTKPIILTGDRPTGKLHLGHYFGSIRSRVALQNQYDTYLLIADVQALTDNFKTPEKVRAHVEEVAIDNFASGIDPDTVTYVIQSAVPAIAELTVFYGNFVTLARLERNPTVKAEIENKKELFAKGVTYGFFGYPISQAADITAFDADLVPVGEDQLPMIELTREIVRRFNFTYETNALIEPQARVTEIPRIRGTDGNAKMSKSLNNCIYLRDTADVIREKVMNAYTDPLKARKTDPGHPEGCVVCEYLRLIDPDGHDQLVADCKSGKMGCMQDKKKLAQMLTEFLDPIRDRAQQFENDRGRVRDILREGSRKGAMKGNEVLSRAKEAMKINYWNSD
ncbi:tryptophan--tRNA ligase [bacterium]|nr:tryptophan--tRNA ligase [candidate division CSSED10-310 bacterium]